ncbi:MAG TPA: protein kinase, partial [Kofleriaceae bacterium]|nr:protein kinase [Kofleriaceae bacterium]
MEALRERFGKYHVLEKIAQGGMAEVYKVKTVGIAGFEKVQALKRILPRQAREGRFIRSFIDEARIAVELTHRNIVQVFDFGKADGELFLAMELIEGKDLRTVMAQAVSRDALPPVPIAAYIISEVASGLDYAHRKADGYGGSLGIVHCDVSPSNVMLSTEGDIKILDFGIARATFASALERRRLRGKPRYMAPEQTIGETPSAASDVFALGIIAWELLTGRPLYRGNDLKAILDAVRRTDPPRIDRIVPAGASVPREIVDAVATALSREPPQRGTAADLAAACARTAMQAGSRALARWLANLESRPSRTAIPWQPEITSISVPPPGEDDDEPPTERPEPSLEPRSRDDRDDRDDRREAFDPMPPARPSATISLHDIRPPLADAPPPTVRSPFADHPPPPARSAFEHEASTTHPRFDAARTTPHTPRFEPTTTTTHARLTDSLAAGAAIEAAPTQVEPPPARRRSYERLDVAAGVSAAALRFDEDATHHGFALPGASEDTRDDEAALGDAEAPIDDDLGSAVAGELAERRRIAIVVALLAGAQPDELRPITKSLGELAYLRGGVVLEIQPDALVVAFGLEIAGEDDVAIAMGWALDAAAMARDTAAESVQLRIGARAGVATTSSPPSGHDAAPTVTVARTPDAGPRIPQDAIDEARALARDAAPD